MMDRSVSVIVPVYNTGELLIPCLESLAAQTLHNLDIILVDDGSKDDSGKICDDFAAGDPRFCVIHKQNEGVSKARNDGIAIAQGDYIGFVDSDDMIRPTMFADMLYLAQEHNADVVLCDAVTVGAGKPDEPDTISCLKESTSVERTAFTSDMLIEMAGSAWRGLYRHALLTEHKIVFPEELKLSEDRIFNLYALGFSRRVYYTKTAYYERLLHYKSAVHRFYPNHFDIIKDGYHRIMRALDEAWGNDESCCQAYMTQFVGGALGAVNSVFYKTSTFTQRKKFQRVKEICNDEELREAIRRTGSGGVRGKWIMQKRILLLSACAILLNQKHGR